MLEIPYSRAAHVQAIRDMQVEKARILLRLAQQAAGRALAMVDAGQQPYTSDLLAIRQAGKLIKTK